MLGAVSSTSGSSGQNSRLTLSLTFPFRHPFEPIFSISQYLLARDLSPWRIDVSLPQLLASISSTKSSAKRPKLGLTSKSPDSTETGIAIKSASPIIGN